VIDCPESFLDLRSGSSGFSLSTPSRIEEARRPPPRPGRSIRREAVPFALHDLRGQSYGEQVTPGESAMPASSGVPEMSAEREASPSLSGSRSKVIFR